MEVNPRIGDDVSDIDRLLFRPVIGYQLTDNFSIWQGYVWVGYFNQPTEPGFFEENRIYQQLNYKEKFSNFNFSSRHRTEKRWIDHVAATAVRFRQMLRADFPIPQAPAWAFVTYDEIIINLNSVDTYDEVLHHGGKGPGSGFDQNRFFVGINKALSSWLYVDLGYHNRTINNCKREGNANQINHIFLLQFWINL